MRNVRLTVQYDGTDYHGFQRQPGLRTVQAVLEDALLSVAKERIVVVGAGRTDAGVHARGQVVSFRTACSVPTDRFPDALNSVLPPDAAAVEGGIAAEDFHARYSATGKAYSYTIVNRPHRCPFRRRYAAFVRFPLDVERMRRAAGLFVGTHDFGAFRGAGSSAETTVRRVSRCEVGATGDEVHVWIEADGFLYKMARMIVGALLEVGRGGAREADIEAALARGRGRVGGTAPARGLCLERVYY